jgi:hypothetical protein
MGSPGPSQVTTARPARLATSPIIAGGGGRLVRATRFLQPPGDYFGLGLAEPRQAAQTGWRGFADRRSSSSDAAVKIRRLSVYLEDREPARLLAGVLEAVEGAAEAQP